MLRFACFFAPVLVAPFLWAANFIAARAVHEVSDPLWLNSARWDAAALVLLPVLWRDRRNVANALRTHFATLVVLALLGVVGSNTLIYYGLEHASATQVGVVYGFTPFLILLMSRVSGGARLDARQSWAGVIAFSGVCFILTGGEMAVLQQEATTGAMFVLAGGALWAGYSVRLHRARLTLAPMTLVAVLATLGALIMLPLMWVRPAPAAEAMVPVLSVVAFLGIAGSALAFWAWGVAVARVGACRTGIGLQMIPVFGALMAWGILGEVPTLAHLIGIVLVVTGLFLACQPTLGTARPACLKAIETTGQIDAFRDHYPKDRRDGYFGRA
ncbi:DMT family transporter [Tropicimonas sp. S265A]|uniref:DMT family transporter n=1 Tax=Tropicimonas sp. S265A TaxID=3415134 RepID=UPI003C7E8E95